MDIFKSYKLLLFIGFIALMFGLLSGLSLGRFDYLFPLTHLALAFMLTVSGTFFYLYKKINKLKNISYLVLKLSYFAIFIILIIFVNYFFYQKNYQYDLTSDKSNSLQIQTIQVLKQIEKPLTIFFVDSKNNRDNLEIKNLLNLFKKEQSKFDYKILNPEIARNIRSYINPALKNIFYLEYGPENDPIIAKLGVFSEAEIANAIMRITTKYQKTFCYVFGKGEPELQSENEEGLSTFGNTVIARSYLLKGLILASVKKLPEDCAALILTLNNKGYSEKERKVIKDYFDLGGRVLIFSGYGENNSYQFLLEDLKIKINKDIILDQMHLLYNSNEIGWDLAINNFSTHPITANFNSSTPIVFSKASSISYPSDLANSKYTPLLFSSRASWGETNLDLLLSKDPKAEFSKDEDLTGPLVLGLAYESFIDETKTRKLVIYSDISWIKNANIESYSNKDLLVNTIEWLITEEKDDFFKIRYNTPNPNKQPLNRTTFQTILLVSFIIPEIIIIFLFLIWFQRNSRND